MGVSHSFDVWKLAANRFMRDKTNLEHALGPGVLAHGRTGLRVLLVFVHLPAHRMSTLIT